MDKSDLSKKLEKAFIKITEGEKRTLTMKHYDDRINILLGVVTSIIDNLSQDDQQKITAALKDRDVRL